MNQKYIEKLLCSRVIMIFIFMHFLLYFCYLGNLGFLENIIRFTAYSLSSFIILYYMLKHKLSKFSICLLLFIVFQFFSTIISEYGSVKIFLSTYFVIIGLCFYYELCVKAEPKKTIGILGMILYILSVVNFVTIILFPNGLYATERYTSNWFFQYDNTHIFMFLPAILINILYDELYRKKISFRTIILLVVIGYCVYYCNSASSVFIYTIFIIYIFFRKTLNYIKLLNINTYIKVGIILFFLIVVFRIQNIFYFLIVEVLHKNMNYTGRTDVWDTVMRYISNNPIIGYGIESTEVFSAKMGHIYYTHAHNTILNVLYKGGVLSLMPFLLIINFAKEKLNLYKETKYVKLISFVMLCYFIMMVFEARETKAGYYLVLVIAFNIDCLIKNRKEMLNYEKESNL